MACDMLISASTLTFGASELVQLVINDKYTNILHISMEDYNIHMEFGCTNLIARR